MSRRRVLALITALTLAALLIHGYHPYSEDGGLYLAGVQRLLNPHLFPAYTAFVTEHQRFSLFAPFIAAVVRLTHLPLDWTILLLYLAALWLTLFAAWLVTSHLTANPSARVTSLTLLATWLTLPVAGTSLILSDPYLTARSFTLPLSLLALSFVLDNNLLLCALTLTLATLFHPLMAGYSLAAVLLVLAVRQPTPTRRFAALTSLFAVALIAASALQSLAPAESPAYLPIALSRYYWFPLWWHSYEQLGLIAPLILLALLHRRAPTLVRATLALGALSLIIALPFARVHLATHIVARLQPLRAYLLIYAVLILLLGAWLGDTLKHRKPVLAVLLLTQATLFFYVQRHTYPASPHLELPVTRATNPWVQAFQWARQNTPQDALFALDPHYITLPGEDAQLFRPIAQRSALPDYSKDGGEAAITPALAPAWTTAQRALDSLSYRIDGRLDADRWNTLHPLGVTWLVLGAHARTALSCPYRNPTVKLCRLTSPQP